MGKKLSERFCAWWGADPFPHRAAREQFWRLYGAIRAAAHDPRIHAVILGDGGVKTIHEGMEFLRISTNGEGAGSHCQADNTLLMNHEVIAWLNKVF